MSDIDKKIKKEPNCNKKKRAQKSQSISDGLGKGYQLLFCFSLHTYNKYLF